MKLLQILLVGALIGFAFPEGGASDPSSRSSSDVAQLKSKLYALANTCKYLINSGMGGTPEYQQAKKEFDECKGQVLEAEPDAEIPVGCHARRHSITPGTNRI